jgi:hypothetical protein
LVYNSPEHLVSDILHPRSVVWNCMLLQSIYTKTCRHLQ